MEKKVKTVSGKCKGVVARGKEFFSALYEKVWTPTEVTCHTLPMRIFTAIWRVTEITVNGTMSNNIPMHAAALTYYALMALAPFVMLVLTIFGIVLNVQGEDAVNIMQERIAETMQLVMPAPEEGAAGAETQAPAGDGKEGITDVPTVDPDAVNTVAPQLEEFSGMILKNTMANSGSSGTIGTLVLAVLAIFMIARVEDAYNLIWNVKKRRSWPRRFLIYFLFLMIGGALSAVTMSMLSVSAVLKRFSDGTSEVSAFAAGVPGGEIFIGVMTSFVPMLLTFAIISGLFACVNRYLPHAGVDWKPAIIGGAFVAVTFISCGKMASLFVKKISEFNSIYGNLSVIFILMFGLYLSWMFLLLGGQISFAVQNAKYFKNINRKWEQLSSRSKQEALFACIFAIFSKCSKSEKGLTMEDLGKELCVQANLISECIATLLDKKLIVPLSSEMDERGRTIYNTAGSIGSMTVAELRRLFDNLRVPLELGGSASTRAALAKFAASFESCTDSTTFEQLLITEKPLNK